MGRVDDVADDDARDSDDAEARSDDSDVCDVKPEDETEDDAFVDEAVASSAAAAAAAAAPACLDDALLALRALVALRTDDAAPEAADRREDAERWEEREAAERKDRWRCCWDWDPGGWDRDRDPTDVPPFAAGEDAEFSAIFSSLSCSDFPLPPPPVREEEDAADRWLLWDRADRADAEDRREDADAADRADFTDAADARLPPPSSSTHPMNSVDTVVVDALSDAAIVEWRWRCERGSVTLMLMLGS